jgi:hypothetical protein
VKNTYVLKLQGYRHENYQWMCSVSATVGFLEVINWNGISLF